MHDEVGVIGSVEVDWDDDGQGRKVHQLGEDIGGVALEIKVPSSQEMEDGRATRQWKLDHESEGESRLCDFATSFALVANIIVRSSQPPAC